MKKNLSQNISLELTQEALEAARQKCFKRNTKILDQCKVTDEALGKTLYQLLNWKETKVFMPKGSIYIDLNGEQGDHGKDERGGKDTVPKNPFEFFPGEDEPKGKGRGKKKGQHDLDLSNILIYSKPIASGAIRMEAVKFAAQLRGLVRDERNIQHTFPGGIPPIHHTVTDITKEELAAALAAQEAFARALFGTSTAPVPKGKPKSGD